jgi:hypothetical protein
VSAARVIFCDAEAHDNGWMHPLDIAGRVRVWGRGGTVLQPGVDLLQEAPDFPKDGPILIITDAMCDHVQVRREHAFLIPAGAALPFKPRGPSSAWPERHQASRTSPCIYAQRERVSQLLS